MQLKKEPFGISSLVEIRGRKRGDGNPTKKELGMGLRFGNLSGRNGITSILVLHLWRVMGRG